MRALLLMLLASACACAAGAASAQWPASPGRMIVADAAGGVPDLAARILAERLSRALGQPVRVENRPGDDGVQAAASAKADGYTWFFASSAVLTLFPYTTDLVPYSPEDDFAGVAVIGSTPLVVVANPALNVKSLSELVTLAHEAPGRLAYASPELRTLPGILGEVLRRRLALELMPVPHRGALNVPDTIAGRTHFTVDTVPAVATAVQRGQLRGLAVTSQKRLPELKDVATLVELYPGFEFSAWYALVAPSGTPDAIVQRVSRETSRLLSDPDVAERMSLLGIYPEAASSPAQVDAFFASERTFWRKTVRELKMEPE